MRILCDSRNQKYVYEDSYKIEITLQLYNLVSKYTCYMFMLNKIHPHLQFEL